MPVSPIKAAVMGLRWVQRLSGARDGRIMKAGEGWLGMLRTIFKSKIHRAVVTSADLHYEGSITIDRALLEAAEICEYERVQIVNIHNGARFETYAIAGPVGSGEICLNGAAARLVQIGDLVIIISYALMSDGEWQGFKPKVVLVDGKNRVVERRGGSNPEAAAPPP